MKRFIHLISLLLCVAMLLSVLPVSTFAVDDLSEQYYWDFTGETPQNVTTEGWAENALSPNATVATSFDLEKPIKLDASKRWTIEWKGQLTNGSQHSVLFSNKKPNVGGNGSTLFILASGVIAPLMKDGYTTEDGYRQQNFATGKGTANLTWYLTNDGTNMTVYGLNSDGVPVVSIQKGSSKNSSGAYAVYDFSTICGYFGVDMNNRYTGSLDYVKVYPESVHFANLEEENYYWDFSDETPTNVTTEGWAENRLTPNATLPTSYDLQKDLQLDASKCWTIEWKGTLSDGTNHGVLFSDKKQGGTVGSCIFILKYGHVATLMNGGIANNDDGYRQQTFTPGGPLENRTWYLTNDGVNLSLYSVDADGTLQYQEVKNSSRNGSTYAVYNFSTINGYFSADNGSHYTGELDYVKVYRQSPVFEQLDLTLINGQTAISGASYTGTVAWSVADEIPVAAITLHAKDGYRFSKAASVAVANAEVTNTVVSEDGLTLTATATYQITEHGPWFGKKWVVFGTSISENENYFRASGAEIKGTYVPYLTELIGTRPAANYSIGGGKLSGHILMYINHSRFINEGVTQNGFTHAKYSDADLILVEGFINDYYSSVPLGAVTDTVPYSSAAPISENPNSTNNYGGTEEGTFAGCVYSAIQTLRNNAPNATIVFVTDNAGTGSCAATRKNTLGYTPHDYTNMVIAVAKRMGCHVIDAGRNSGFETNSEYLSDHIHQSQAGGQAFANYIYSELCEITDKQAVAEPDYPWEPAIDEESANYYWDFTRPAGEQNVVENGWKSNPLTYLTAQGTYQMEKPVTLPMNAPWTIEWQGSSPASSVVLANNNPAVDTDTKHAEYIYIANNAGQPDMTALYMPTHNTALSTSIATLTNIKDSTKRNANTVWYIIHDGHGNLTIATYDGNEVHSFYKENALARDLTYNAIRGYYIVSMPIAYSGTMKYMKIYNEAATLPVVEEETLSIQSASLILNGKIDAVFHAQVPANYTDARMVINATDIAASGTNEDGTLRFVYAGITPQCMGDSINATLYATKNGTEESVTLENFSVRQYCVTQLAKEAVTGELRTLLSDLLAYGAAAQTFTDYKTDSLVNVGNDIVNPTYSTFTALSDLSASFEGTAAEDTCWISAGLTLTNSVAMNFRFYAESTDNLSANVTINGRTQTFTEFTPIDGKEGFYEISFTGISAEEFADNVSASFTKNDIPIGNTVSYNVNTYISAKQADGNASLQALVKALYNYGVAATDYRSK